MTREKAEALARDLERADGVQIIRTEPQPDPNGDKWQVYIWSDDTHAFHTITGAKVFREAVHAGLTPVLPKGALDLPKVKKGSDNSPSRKGRGFSRLAPMRCCPTATRVVAFNTREVDCAAPASQTSTTSKAR